MQYNCFGWRLFSFPWDFIPVSTDQNLWLRFLRVQTRTVECCWLLTDMLAATPMPNLPALSFGKPQAVLLNRASLILCISNNYKNLLFYLLRKIARCLLKNNSRRKIALNRKKLWPKRFKDKRCESSLVLAPILSCCHNYVVAFMGQSAHAPSLCRTALWAA